MKDSITLKPKGKKASSPNVELLDLQRKYGYSSFQLTDEQFKKKLKNSINKIRLGLSITKEIIR